MSLMKPKVIVLGGCGFIGRNFVDFLIRNDLVEHVRVVDKVPPQIAWLNHDHQAIFKDPKVSFISANLINRESCIRAFLPDKSGVPFDFVVNCAGETKYGQTDAVYKEGILRLSSLCATEAAKICVKHYVEISSGNMGSSDKVPLKEDCKKEPWTAVAKWKSEVEDYLATVPGLQYTILRPGIVYGLGDKHGLMPRFVVGAIYKHMGECMKLLWTRDIKMNTVDVQDVCRAIWHVLFREDTKGQIYNLVDESDSTQGSISSLVSEIFNINHDYWGSTISTIAKTDMACLMKEVNDKHMAPWAEMCAKDEIFNTPLSPYIDRELLYNKHLYLNGTKLRDTGFSYSFPKLTVERCKEVLQDHAKMNLFPKSYLSME